MTTEHTRHQLAARTVRGRLCILNRRGKRNLRHTVPAGRLRLWRHGLLRELRLRLLYQELLVFVFPIDLIHLQLCGQRPLVVEAVEDAEGEGGVAEDLRAQGNG
jgi:hypothetical protein